jgi:MFS family permease
MADASQEPTSSFGLSRSSSVISVMISTSFPPFLLGAFAVTLQRELGFGPGLLGMAVALYFGTTSLLATRISRMVQRIGARHGLLVASGFGAVSMYGFAAARNPNDLLILMVIGGLGNATAHPAVNAVLFRHIPRRHHGLAFGTKQACVPIATFLGGLAVPIVAITIGWRAGFVVAATLGLINGIAAWRSVEDMGPNVLHSRRRVDRSAPIPRPLRLFALAAGVGAFSGNSVGVFLVDAGVRTAGLLEQTSAIIFAVASMAAIATRVASGILIDHRPGTVRVPATIALMIGGAVGFGLLTTGRPTLFALGAVLAYGAGWGWTGLTHYLVVDDYSAFPERATGVLITGFAFGSSSGPLVFGQVAARFGYQGVWMTSIVATLLAAVAMWVAWRITPADAPSRSAVRGRRD